MSQMCRTDAVCILITDDRPSTSHFGKFQMAYISTHPLNHFMYIRPPYSALRHYT